MLGRHRVDDEVERARQRLKVRRLRAEHEGTGPEFLGVAFLAGRSAEDRDVRAHRPRDLHRHVAETADPDHTHAASLADLVSLEGRIGGDACTQERRDTSKRNALLDPQGVFLPDDDVGGVAALRGRLPIQLSAVVGERNMLLTELLLAGPARLARAAGIDQAADARQVADLEAPNLLSRGDDRADDFMPRHARIGGRPPLRPGGVDVGVADAAVGDLDDDVVRPGIAAFEAKRLQRLGRRKGCVGFRGNHVSSRWGVGEPKGRRSMGMGMEVATKFTDESLARHLHVDPSRRAFRINRLAHRLTRAAERRTPALGIV